MRNKKSLLTLGLISFVLVLGVGYAVVSNVNLEFGGTASVQDSNLNVYIKSYTDSRNDNTVTNQILNNGKSASFSISNMTLDEEVTITYTIENGETDVDAVLSTQTALTGNNEYFEASYVIDDANISAGDTTTVTVTVTMIKTPVSETDGSAEFNFELVANPSDNS